MTQQPCLPEVILETANFHGGDAALLKTAIETFAALVYTPRAIKFHAHRYDRVALSDYSWYEPSKRFYIPPETWRELIALAHAKGFKVWLDLFCTYGVEVLAENLAAIQGIKLQPSILDNHEVLGALQRLDLHDTELIINVSGLDLSAIESYLASLGPLKLKKIVLQLGFQNFPTRIADSSLAKIAVLQAAFPGIALAYADHIDGGDPFAGRFPVYAWLHGCQVLEKHICLHRAETEFDASAALEFGEIEAFTQELQRVQQCFAAGFIGANERRYLQKSIQKPVLRGELAAGQLVAASDVVFRRTDQAGMNWQELKQLQGNGFVLNNPVHANESLPAKKYKKARVAVIVAVRMKSSRLKHKAILPLDGVSSIQRCMENCLQFPGCDEVVLATSTLPEDAVLQEHTLNGRVHFWAGDPDDVIARYLGACERHNIDVVVRLTGDSPVVSPEIADVLIRSHFDSGADFSEVRQFAVGTNCQVYNVETLRRIIAYKGRAEYSEHMTFYVTNNPELFKINTIDLPPELVRDYRLTLDYPEDLEMFNALYKALAAQKMDARLLNVFAVLDAQPEIARINAHKAQIYTLDENLRRTLMEKTKIHLPARP